MTDPLEQVNLVLGKAVRAAAIFSQLDQAHTDRIVKAVYLAGLGKRVELAKMALQETGIGKWQDKVIKNVVATQLVYEDIKDLKTVGVISDNRDKGIIEIAQPLGPVLAITPVTNPTSTVMFKILIALKTRNPIIVSPHRRATECSIQAASICYEAALREDAPEDCIQWVKHTSREQTQALMGHRQLALTIATGGGSLVKAAYSSGNPALGVGAGNVPVFVEESADIPFAAEQIFLSKTFDNGTVCCSEQSIVVQRSVAEALKEELKNQGGYFLSDQEIRQVEKVAFDDKRGIMSAAIVGKSAAYIAELAGISLPEGTRVLIAPLKGIGKEFKLSSEILAPILGFYVADGFQHAVNLCIELNFHGGIGHTASIFSNNKDRIKQFAMVMNAGRIVVNMPSSQGGVGGIYNTLHPSLTLGCGASGKNITTDNITATHLLNIQRVTKRRTNERLERFDAGVYLDPAITGEDIEHLYNRNY